MRHGLLLLFCLLTFNFIAQDQVLFINEILASNLADSQDDFNEWDDWLEIYYAAGSTPAVFDIAGYYLSDDPDSLDKWQIPNTNPGITTIVAGQHLLFWIDKDPEQGEDHASFKLSSDGETIFFVEPDGMTIVDSIAYPMQASDISYGRSCDGCADWVYFNNTTPDDPNMEIPPGPELLFINEVLAVNVDNIDDSESEFDPWLEIYNPNPYQVNLADYYISNTEDTQLFQFPTNNPVLTVVPANGFLLIWCDNETGQAENHVNFTLDEGGGTLTLTHSDMSTVDTYTYPEATADISWGRQDDGALNSIGFTTPTPRVSNSIVIVLPEELYINEIMTFNTADTLDNYFEVEDWFEIYNPNPYPVNLAGYYFTDNEENPQKWKVPNYEADSTTVPAGGWLLFWADEDASQGINHTSFRFNNAGELLQMFSPDGFTLADEKSWSLQFANISRGRVMDGAASWVNFLETTPEASNNNATVDIKEASNTLKPLSAWPNPVSNGRLHLSENIDIEVFDVHGRLLFNQNNTNELNVTSLRAGMYLLRATDGRSLRILVK